jgi:hypothetical protein
MKIFLNMCGALTQQALEYLSILLLLEKKIPQITSKNYQIIEAPLKFDSKY